MGKKNPYRILFLKDQKSSSNNFQVYLEKKHNVDVYSYSMSDKIEKVFGDLNFVEDLYTEPSNYKGLRIDNILASWCRNYSSEYLIEEIGIEPCTDWSLKEQMKFLFEKFEFKFDETEKVKEIIKKNLNSNLVINKIEARNYNLIIIENLATLIELPDKSKNFIFFKIPPSHLKQLLKSGVTVLHLMNYGDGTLNFNSDQIKIYKQTLDNLGICSFATEKEFFHYHEHEYFLLGIDKKMLSNNPSDFRITINKNYKKNLSERFHFLYDKVNKLYVKWPLHLFSDNGDNIALTGNSTTKLIMARDSTPEIVNKYFKHNNSLPIFGMNNVNNLVLSGGITDDSFFDNKKCNNKKFIENVLEYLKSGIKFPRVKIDIEKGKIYIDQTELNLSPMEFCYYRYFLQAAKKNEGKIMVVDSYDSEFNKNKKAELSISNEMIREVIDYYNQSFPYNDNCKRLEDKYKKKDTPNIKQTFNGTIMKINKKISNSLQEIFPKNIIESLKINKSGSGDQLSCEIEYPSQMIKVQSNS